MEMTNEQALQQGVAALKEGRLDDAERLYRSILKSQPLHPEANYYLGVLAVSMNKVDAALPLFKTALDVNPKIEQFWLSYIDALIKDNQIKGAKQAIKKAKKIGVANKKLQASWLQSKVPAGPKAPPQEHLTRLLEYYQAGQYGDAEKLALSIIQEFPENPFAWKALGAVLEKLDRKSEAVNANQKSVALSPQDAEAHNNLGVSLKELGRLDDSETSYAQAITLKPDYAEAYNNRGNTLKELGRLDESEASLRQAIAYKPNFVEAHSNLGNTLKELGRLEEAEASYMQAIVLKPDYAEAYNNMAITLQELGKLDKAEALLRQAIALKLDYAEAHKNLANSLKEQGRLNEAVASYTHSIALKSDNAEAHNSLGVALQQLDRLDEAEASLRQTTVLNPDHAEAHDNLLTCLYLMDEKSLFFDELDYLINQDKANAVIGSLTCRSALKYGLEKPNLFCREPLKYVLHNDLNTQYDFEEIFVKNAKSILNENKISNRKQSLLMNGYQTSGNLFDIEHAFTEKIQKFIRLEIEKYRINFKNSEEGLIKKWPTEYSLYGWLISMKSGGKLQPHIHNKGWLSGSIYINIPLKSEIHSGNLVVSLGEEKDAIDTRINVEKIIDVVTGSLVLFPASLTHYTIPFESEEERIVLAFDVRQK